MGFVINDPVQTALEKTLDACALRQRVIADNIANVDTPGFKKNTVQFEEALSRALRGEALSLQVSDPRHIGNDSLAAVKPEVEEIRNTTLRTDGNNVDLDEEMINLVTNTLEYRAAAQFLSGKFKTLHYVISGGR